jgi:hypothetical protein
VEKVLTVDTIAQYRRDGYVVVRGLVGERSVAA